jgi:peptidoglycan/LPS O-acetylase OafA/YrhL
MIKTLLKRGLAARICVRVFSSLVQWELTGQTGTRNDESWWDSQLSLALGHQLSSPVNVNATLVLVYIYVYKRGIVRWLINLSATQRRIFIFSFGRVDKYLGGVQLLTLAGASWQRPERPRKKFNKICFLGLHGEIWDRNIGNFTNNQIWNYQIKIYIICRGAKTFRAMPNASGGGGVCANHFWGGAPPPAPPRKSVPAWMVMPLTVFSIAIQLGWLCRWLSSA